jgi:hypothetical protein
MIKKRLLIIFIKNPELGKCKTRLAATVGDEKALQFYKKMLERTHEVVLPVNAHKTVFYSGFIDKNDQWAENNQFSKALQKAGDLGDKMNLAFEESFKAGYESICIIGSDCYELDTETISNAFSILENKDAVIGPSTDGGYYLIGMNRLIPEVFTNKKWSTETVSADSIDDFRNLHISFGELQALTDIDTEEDLKTMPAEVVEKFMVVV